MTLFEKSPAKEQTQDRTERFVFAGKSEDFYPNPGETVVIECVSGQGSLYIGDDNQFPIEPGDRYGGVTSGSGWRVVPHPSAPLHIDVHTRLE